MAKTKIDLEVLQYAVEAERKQAERSAKAEVLREDIRKLCGQLYAKLLLLQAYSTYSKNEFRLFTQLGRVGEVKKFLHGTKQEFVRFANRYF